MDHFEMVERLREKANVSYDEAKQALEASDWDLLEALIYLENEGKMKAGPREAFTTRREDRPEKPGTAHLGPGVFRRLLQAFSRLVAKANRIDFEARKKGETVFSLPLTVLIVLLIFLFWPVLVILVLGLFFDLRYSLKGAGGVEAVNRAMDRAARAADGIRGLGREEEPEEDRS